MTFIVLPLFGQQHEIPQKEFDIRSTPGTIEVSRGGSGSIILAIARSKSYQRSEAQLGTGSSLPQGISLVYEKALGVAHETKVTIVVSDQAAAGDFNLILNCTMHHKTKGVVVRVKII